MKHVGKLLACIMLVVFTATLAVAASGGNQKNVSIPDTAK